MRIFKWLLLPTLGLLCQSASAVIFTPTDSRPAPAAVPEEFRPAEAAHIQTRALRPDQIPPRPATRDHLFRSYDAPSPASLQRIVACDLSVFASASASALVDAVKAAEVTGCLYGLYDVRGTQAGQIFSDAKMLAIANTMASDSATYDGSNAGGMLQLVTFLRAAYYVQYVDPSNVPAWSAALKPAVREATDAFFANPHISDVNQVHGETLSEVVILVDSSAQHAYQLDNLMSLLGRYGPSYQSSSYMRSSVNGVFNVLYKGQWNTEYVAAIPAAGDAVSSALLAFIQDNSAADVGTSREYLLTNAAGELGRLLMYPSLRSMLRPKIKTVLDLYGIVGTGAGIYGWLANMVIYYDNAECAYYGLCTFLDDLAAIVLPAESARDCSPTLKVRSQSLTSSQLDTVCATVGGEESYFHDVSLTGGTPVADDYNTRLEMVIFHSSADYETYSAQLFGNNTNNGGIYLEGDPANPNNQARFIAYEAEWLRPDFEVWNLTHEYIHYLDGRFNWYGGFNALPMSAPYSVIWYIEGFAEFLSYSYRELVYASAVTEAATPDKFTLPQLFNTIYDTDYTRIYQWGYLATRFMFERHHDDIASLYAVSRPGNYSPGYRAWIDSIRNAYTDEFRAWVACFGTSNGDTSECEVVGPDAIYADGFETQPPDTTPECTATDVRVLANGCKRSGLAATAANQRVYLYAYLPAGVQTLKFTMLGGQGDADMYVRYNAWPTDSEYDQSSATDGNHEVVEITAPASGYHYIMLRPRTSWFSEVQVRADWQ